MVKVQIVLEQARKEKDCIFYQVRQSLGATNLLLLLLLRLLLLPVSEFLLTFLTTF
jgi:hypothetical protein